MLFRSVPAAGVAALAGVPLLAVRTRRVRGGRRVTDGRHFRGGRRGRRRRGAGARGDLLVVWVVGLECEYQAVEGQFEDPAGIVDDVGLLYS